MDTRAGQVAPFRPRPAGPAPDEEWVAALVEARLLPAEEAQLVERIRRNPAARAEIRALALGRWRALNHVHGPHGRRRR